MSTVSGLFTSPPVKPPEVRDKPFLFKEISVVRWHTNTSAFPITKKIGEAGGYIYQVFAFIGSLFVRGGASSDRPLPGILKNIADVAGRSLKFVQIGFIAISAGHFIGMCFEVKKLIVGTFEEKLEGAFKALKSISEIFYALIVALKGMQAASIISSHAIRWIPGLNIAAAFLSGGEMLLHGKNAIDLSRYSDELLKALDTNDTKEIRKALRRVRLEKNERFFEQMYDVDGDEMRKQLRFITQDAHRLLTSKKEADQERGKIVLSTTLGNLRARVQHKAFSEKMMALASLISLIGLVALAFSPIAPIGALAFGLLAVSSLIFVAILIYDRVSRHQFRRAIGAVE